MGSTQEAVEDHDHCQAAPRPRRPRPPSHLRRRRRRGQASAELRQAIEGREHEFAGIGFIAVGLLLGLAIYLNLAGPLGRGTETVVGWLTGLGRFVVPIALIAIGAALVGKGQSMRRFKLAIGWGLLGLSLLGLLHVVRGPDKIMADFDTLGRAGGWIGALVGEPLRSLIASGGAIVVLVSTCIGGALVLTGASLRSMLSNTGKGVGAVAMPIGRRARSAFGNMSTLRSDRQGSGELPMPTLYDAALDEDWDEPDKPRRPRAPRQLPPPGAVDPGLVEQSELELGPGAKRGQWVLPPANYLDAAAQQTINKAEVEARGRTLVDALTSHGVETNLLGQTVGPTVTRYELELGSGVKVARVTSLNRDIAYAMAATDVRILAPIPGRTAIGVEVPNHTRQLVSLGDIMASSEAKTATHPLDVAIGKDIAGRSVFLNLATTPHLLIAGTTGAGKSSGLNCILTSCSCAARQTRCASSSSTRSRSRWASTTGCHICSPNP